MIKLPRTIYGPLILSLCWVLLTPKLKAELPQLKPMPFLTLSSEPKPSEELITLTGDELSAIITDAVDTAVDLAVREVIAEERPGRLAAEKKVKAWETALPWGIAGTVVLAGAAFVGGLFLGLR